MDASASTPPAAAGQANAGNGAIRPFTVEVPECSGGRPGWLSGEEGEAPLSHSMTLAPDLRA
jgi:hypothetical protein